MPPKDYMYNRTTERQDLAEEDISQLKLDLALTKKDLENVTKTVNEIQTELKKIQGYFIKAFFGIGALVGTYFVKWVLSGGLAPFIAS